MIRHSSSAALLLLLCTMLATQAVPADCTRTSVGLIPLTELGSRFYQGRQGGLYPGGSNKLPAAHEAAGLAAARSIRPLDAQGLPDEARGKIVLISILCE